MQSTRLVAAVAELGSFGKIMLVLSVNQLIEEGATHSNSEVEVVGWAVDRFEHRAIYDSQAAAMSAAAAITPSSSHGIQIRGTLPERKTIRGDGPLHGLRVKLTGKFHWQPRSLLWPAWIGVKSHEVIDQIAEPDAGPSSRPPSHLQRSSQVQTPDSLRTSSPGGCG